MVRISLPFVVRSLPLAVAVLLVGCFGATTAGQRYYTLDLPKVATTTATALRLPADLLVQEVEVAPVCNRAQIVYRLSAHELQFFYQNTWADRPSRMLGQVLAKELQDRGNFRSVVQRLGDSPPDYTFESTVVALEELRGADSSFAHLTMTFRLVAFASGKILWQHSFDEQRPLGQHQVDLVVRALSMILQEQLALAVPHMVLAVHKASGKSGVALPPPPGPTAVASPEPATPTHTESEPAAPLPRKALVAADRPAADATYDGNNGHLINWRRDPQFLSDPTLLPPGQGAVFLPALSGKPDKEPPVTVLDGRRKVATGTMGRRIPLAPGRYTVDFGSGQMAQHQRRIVTIRDQEVVVIQPDWASLHVSVVDRNFVPFLGNYELFRMDTRAYQGVGYGVAEELGQEPQVWIVRPGLFKLVQTGATYRARTNFSTVRLLAGMAVPFTLVQDLVTREFLGAGVTEPRQQRRIRSDWSLRATVGGSVALDDRTSGFSAAPAGSALAVDLFSDTWLQWKRDQHLWTNRLEVEGGQSLSPQIGPDNRAGKLLDGRLQSTKDRIYLNSMYLFQYLPWLGPYVRVRAETSMFHHYAFFAVPTPVSVIGQDGVVRPAGRQVSAQQLLSPLSPIALRQSAGANWRAVYNAWMDLNLRGGLGSYQYFTGGQLAPSDDAATSEFEFRRVPNVALTGVELSGLAQARPHRLLQLSSELDLLLPFVGLAASQLVWRSTASLHLSSFAALTYTLQVLRQPQIQPDQPLAYAQGVQLRFFWGLL